MDKQIWLVLGILSCLFASGFAAAAEGAEDAPEGSWWIVMMRNEPTLCGQTSEGQLLCLHGEPLAKLSASPLKKVGTLAHDWSFLETGPGPI